MPTKHGQQLCDNTSETSCTFLARTTNPGLYCRTVDFCHATRHTPIVVSRKPTRPANPAKNVEGDFGQFTNFMKRLLAVPYSEIKAKLDAEKRAKARKF